jgi:hypothetical protein
MASFVNWLQANAVELIGDVLKVLGLIAAAYTVVWQMRRQHANSLALQRENAREALKLRIYETLIQRVRALSDAHIEAGMYVFLIPPAIESLLREQAAGFQPSPLKQRALAFSDLHSKAQNHLAELLIEFECWSIAFPGLKVFQVALNAAAYDATQAFAPLFSALLPILPMAPPPRQSDKPTIIHRPPSPETFAALKRLIEQYKEAMDEIGCYIQDLTVEAQNNLLHGLFEARVPPRQPLDPKHKVISTVPEKAQELIRYFETETPWGKNLAIINAEVIADAHAKAAAAR